MHQQFNFISSACASSAEQMRSWLCSRHLLPCKSNGVATLWNDAVCRQEMKTSDSKASTFLQVQFLRKTWFFFFLFIFIFFYCRALKSHSLKRIRFLSHRVTPAEVCRNPDMGTSSIHSQPPQIHNKPKKKKKHPLERKKVFSTRDLFIQWSEKKKKHCWVWSTLLFA